MYLECFSLVNELDAIANTHLEINMPSPAPDCSTTPLKNALYSE